VRRALELGVNIVDSAVNYRHQRSERSVGAALRALVGEVRIGREDVLLATKGGFLPHTVESYVRAGIVEARDVVADGHCIAPRYLADQLERSRANLGVETIDVYYVHNQTQLAAVDRPTFLARMRAAFDPGRCGARRQDPLVRGGHVDRLPQPRPRAIISLPGWWVGAEVGGSVTSA
jgi:aryl-alcohol dehydrogenase-like predicted oxidoreductase